MMIKSLPNHRELGDTDTDTDTEQERLAGIRSFSREAIKSVKI